VRDELGRIVFSHIHIPTQPRTAEIPGKQPQSQTRSAGGAGHASRDAPGSCKHRAGSRQAIFSARGCRHVIPLALARTSSCVCRRRSSSVNGPRSAHSAGGVHYPALVLARTGRAPSGSEPAWGRWRSALPKSPSSTEPAPFPSARLDFAAPSRRGGGRSDTKAAEERLLRGGASSPPRREAARQGGAVQCNAVYANALFGAP
jgi:hypothetical protein